MPNGGEIKIRTKNTVLNHEIAASHGNVPAGQYVTISITDTGIGMSAEVLRRACDPFFTTKPVGQGTGLGLSMLHGFVRQSGGYIQIVSEPAMGTTVDIQLPMHFGQASAIRPNERSFALAQAGINATVLVVEDEAPLRASIVEMLRESGCAVFDASEGKEGLALLKTHCDIGLLVTDIGLPGAMNGQQLVEAARESRPEIKVLFITGYGDIAIVRNLPIDNDTQLLHKPFTMGQLCSAIGSLVANN
jgi:CheY-like chemotaxis protein